MEQPGVAKDTSFSVGWTVGGTAIMFGTNFVGGLLFGMAGVTSTGAMLLLALVCFALGGFIIGKQSPGQTILEAGLAAAAAVIITHVVKVAVMGAELNFIALIIGSAIPFGAGLLGEKAQDGA